MYARFSEYGICMKVVLNGTETEVETGMTVAALLAARELPRQGVAVAVDNRLVPRTEWETHRLAEGAKITVIRAVCGG